uniref:Chromosome 9 open reading frame 40 n=1 Tax=Canis lupus dingo TaxID=286419 RepID=A0A8C0LSF4_CANLU
MAKRRAAEPLTFHVPWKRLLLCDFPEEPPPPPPPPLWIPPPGKRRDGGDTGVPGGVQRDGRGLETGEPPLQQPPARPRGPGEEPRGARPPRGGGDDGAGRSPMWDSIPEFWQYNTFQYWRNPLPPIDLADIEDVIEDNSTEAALQGKNEVVEIDMES